MRVYPDQYFSLVYNIYIQIPYEYLQYFSITIKY